MGPRLIYSNLGSAILFKISLVLGGFAEMFAPFLGGAMPQNKIFEFVFLCVIEFRIRISF